MKNITQFLSEVRVELAKVEWPKFDDFVGSTIIVFIILIIFTIFFGVVDKVISLIAKQFFALMS